MERAVCMELSCINTTCNADFDNDASDDVCKAYCFRGVAAADEVVNPLQKKEKLQWKVATMSRTNNIISTFMQLVGTKEEMKVNLLSVSLSHHFSHTPNRYSRTCVSSTYRT